MRDELVLVGFGEQALADHLAVAEHRVAVGDAVDLVELVADEQDRLAVALQELDQLEELLDFLGRQRGRRLVHDDDLRVDRHGARDRDQMLVGDAEIAQPRVGIDVAGAHRLQHFAGAGCAWCASRSCRSALRGAWPRKMFSATDRSSNSTVSWWMAVMPCAKAACALGKRDRMRRRSRSRRRRAGRCRSGS